ncbi:MAG TPA: hypothetical protein VFZ61_10335 [Polyangiales bacterium]
MTVDHLGRDRVKDACMVCRRPVWEAPWWACSGFQGERCALCGCAMSWVASVTPPKEQRDAEE